MTPKAQTLYSLVVRIRACFNRLKGLADELHRGLNVNASMRAVMETLVADEPQTVPGIARAKGVSRQHIQVNMDALLAERLVESRENPAHKRSPIYVLTKSGREAFSKIRRREISVIERLAEGLPVESLELAEALLTALNERLIHEQEKAITDGQK